MQMQLRGICALRAAPPRPTRFAACQQTPPARNGEAAPATSQARSRGPNRFPSVLPRKKPSMSEFPCKKRDDYLEWPEYFMAVAFLSAQRSKDPNSQVGACIVNAENKIVGIGYNGMPNGCSDDLLPWRRTAESILDTKYPYVCHAELNAIMNKNSADVKGCTMYVALFPCNECAKLIIQAGNSHQSAARLSLTLIQLTADRVRSSSDLHLIKSPEDRIILF
ncbi:deoxycytidylate deaminase isoform X2 [Pseudorca crassidens]|uniref:deoxycytidylate deaminase isoform X2 n=2 Tax=Delphinidae TaxID=9726 RepID=UPI00352E8CDF